MYAHELEVISRALRFLDAGAFRNIALGQNYFDMVTLPYEAPKLCQTSDSIASNSIARH